MIAIPFQKMSRLPGAVLFVQLAVQMQTLIPQAVDMQGRQLQQRLVLDDAFVQAGVNIGGALEGVGLGVWAHSYQGRAASHEYGKAPVLVPQPGLGIITLITSRDTASVHEAPAALSLKQKTGANLGALAETHEADPLAGSALSVVIIHGAFELVANLLNGTRGVDGLVVGQPAQPTAVRPHVRIYREDARTSVAKERRVSEDETEGCREMVQQTTGLQAENLARHATACCGEMRVSLEKVVREEWERTVEAEDAGKVEGGVCGGGAHVGARVVQGGGC